MSAADLATTTAMIRNIVALARAISVDDAAAVWEQFERNEAVIPMVDPTAWIQHGHAAQRGTRVAGAFLAFRRRLAEIEAEESQR